MCTLLMVPIPQLGVLQKHKGIFETPLLAQIIDRANDSERLIRVCSDRKATTRNTDVSQKVLSAHSVPSPSSQCSTQFDHIFTAHRCRGSVGEYRSFWLIPVTSCHAFVHTHYWSHLIYENINRNFTCSAQLLTNDNRRLQFQSKVSARLSTEPNAHDLSYY